MGQEFAEWFGRSGFFFKRTFKQALYEVGGGGGADGPAHALTQLARRRDERARIRIAILEEFLRASGCLLRGRSDEVGFPHRLGLLVIGEGLEMGDEGNACLIFPIALQVGMDEQETCGLRIGSLFHGELECIGGLIVFAPLHQFTGFEVVERGHVIGICPAIGVDRLRGIVKAPQLQLQVGENHIERGMVGEECRIRGLEGINRLLRSSALEIRAGEEHVRLLGRLHVEPGRRTSRRTFPILTGQLDLSRNELGFHERGVFGQSGLDVPLGRIQLRAVQIESRALDEQGRVFRIALDGFVQGAVRRFTKALLDKQGREGPEDFGPAVW